MKNDFDDINEGVRSRTRAKRRKTNLILNSLIVIVVLLIVIVSANIFFGNDEGTTDSQATAEKDKVASSSKNDSNNETGSKETEKKEQEATDEKDAVENDKASNEENATDESGEESEKSEDPIVTEGGSDSNVKQTIENPAWEPVGTTQTGEHVTVFDQGSVDWKEMIIAYSYATGIDKNNMTVWWNENNGAPNTALGTISAKGSDQTFRVSIVWVEGQGWKPVKVEELHQNDKR